MWDSQKENDVYYGALDVKVTECYESDGYSISGLCKLVVQ